MKFDFSEVRQLARTLTSSANKIEKQADRAVRRAGLEAVGIAQSNAPVDTGFHRASIGMDILGPADVLVGAASNYSPFLEDGTWRMPARPHIHPAVDAVTPGLEAALAQLATDPFTA